MDGLAGQGALLVDVAAEDGHGADAEAQSEERLPHGGIDGLPDAVLEHLAEVGLQIEQDAFFGPRQGDGADHQKDHDDKQATHHDFGNALDAPLQSHGTDEEPGEDRNGHPADLIKRIAERPAEERADLLGRKARKLARAHVPAVGQHPPGDGRIEHHQHVTADDAPVAVQMPERPLGFQLAERQADALLGGPAHGELHHHNGKAENDEKNEIDEDESRPTVGSGDEGEAPDVAEADGAAGR